MYPSHSESSSVSGTRTQTAVSARSALYFAQAVIALLVAGCSVGPRYKQPVTKLQPYHNAPAIESRTAAPPAPALDTWWTGFNDPALTKIVERALAQNLDLAASVARVEQARAAAQEAGARRKPNVDLEGASTSLRQSLDSPSAAAFPGFNRNQSYLDLGVGATWEIDIFGGLRRGAETRRRGGECGRAGSRSRAVRDTRLRGG
jgi:outer membrane protein TolC